MWPFRRRTERRAITSVPWDVGGPSRGSVDQGRALSLAPVYAANRHLADQISTLPLHGFRRSGGAREPLSALPQLFKLLDESGQLPAWLYTAVTSLGLRGNAVGLVTNRDGMQFATEVTWLPVDEVHVDDTILSRPLWYWRGRRIDRLDIVHIPWFKIAGRTLGLSPIEAYALTILNGLQAQEYGSDWFAAGGFPPGTFKNSAKVVPQEEADVIKARLVAAIRRRQPLVYGSDWDYNPITVPPEQAQFIETMKLTANQVAAIYGITPDEVGGEAANSLTYTNEEHRQTSRMANLRPWLVRLEAGFSALLPERQYVRFNADAVIRADLKTRYEVYKIAREIGLSNVDELRALEEQPPLPNGAGQDYTPLGRSAPPIGSRDLPNPPDPTGNGHRKHNPALTPGGNP